MTLAALRFVRTRYIPCFAGMAPHPGIDTDQIKEKARKDLLNLLEGVCKAHQTISFSNSIAELR